MKKISEHAPAGKTNVNEFLRRTVSRLRRLRLGRNWRLFTVRPETRRPVACLRRFTGADWANIRREAPPAYRWCWSEMESMKIGCWDYRSAANHERMLSSWLDHYMVSLKSELQTYSVLENSMIKTKQKKKNYPGMNCFPGTYVYLLAHMQ